MAFNRSPRPILWFTAAVLLGGTAVYCSADDDAAPVASDPGPTPAERVDFTCTPTYAETHAYLKQLAASCRHIHFANCGYSTEGYPLPTVFVHDSSGPGGGWDDGQHKPTVLITACIHAGEVCGKDALLLLLRDIARGALPDVVAGLRLILVPIFNPDGHERRSPHNRFTQLGPACGCGTRRNAVGCDLNRDFAKLETSECRALVRLAAQFQPHIYLDLHTNDGMGHQYDILFDCAVNPTFPGRRAALTYEGLQPHILERMEHAGFHAHRIVWAADALDLSQGLVAYGLGPRHSTGYFETRQALSLLVEAYPYQPYERRVRATDAFVRAVLGYAAAHRIEISETVDKARATAIAWPRRAELPHIGLGYHASRTEGRMIDWLGKHFEVVTSDITGRRYALYDEVDQIYRVPFFDIMVPDTTVVMPRGYLMEAAWDNVAATLRRHAIVVQRLTQPFTAEVEVFHIDDVTFRSKSYQGHHPVEALTGSWSVERHTFPAGTYWIPLDHPAGLTAMHLLEPAGDDALLRWNAFDTIFESGIILERWALEENARRLLADADVRGAYEEALRDSAFAADPRARLDFFHRQTPYVEERKNRYPVFRLCADPPRYVGP